MRLYRAVLLMIAVSAVVFVAGCSGGGNQFMPNPGPTPNPNPSPTPPPVPSPTPPPAPSPTPSVSVSLSVLPASLQINGATSFTATVTNDSQNAGVNWTVTCTTSGGTCGSFNATTTASGTANSFIAPAVVPTNNTVTVTATSVTDSAISASANLTITPPVLADGTYVYRLLGEDSAVNPPGPFAAVGAFTVTSGTITGGEQDFVDANGSVFSNSLGGSLGGTADGNFQITITGTGAGVNGTETLNGTVLSATNALITEFDSFATAHGNLLLQTTPIAAPSGGFAFDVAGLNGSSHRAPIAIGGVINVDGSGTISGSGSVFDINDATLTPLENQSFAASTVTAPDSFGRVVFALVPSAASRIQSINLVGYIATTQNIALVETSDTFGGVMGGAAFKQGSNTGNFTTASIAGSSFVFSTVGADTQGPAQLAGVLTANSDGATLSGSLNFNDLTGTGTQSPITVSGTYTVDPTGRVTLSNITDGSGFNATLQLYFSGKAISAGISMNAGDVLAGPVFLQTGGGSFTAASFSGSYGANPHGFDANVNNKLEFDSVGLVSVDGVGALTATVDQNVMTPPPTQTPGVSASGTFNANANGVFTGTIAGFDVTAAANVDSFTYYVVDTTRVIAIETDPNQLTLINFALKH